MSSDLNGNPREKLADFPKMWTIVKKNWLVLKSDRVRLVPMLMFPFIMLIIFGYTTGSIPKLIPAAVADYDHSDLSRQLVGQLRSNQLFLIEHEVGSEEEGKKLIDSGNVKVFFIIPPGFEKDVISSQPVTISVIADESDPTIAQIVKASTQVFVGQISDQLTAQRLADISRRSAAEAEKIGAVSGSLGAVAGMQSDQPLSMMFARYSDSQKIVSQSIIPLKISGERLQNSLGFLINPSGIYLGTNSDNRLSASWRQAQAFQQAVLDQAAATQAAIALDQRLALNAAQMNAAGQQLAAQSNRLKAQVLLSISSLNRSRQELVDLGSSAEQAIATPLSLKQLNPYGSGRRGIDFLLPSILALIIFQGAVAGLGRAIAGERQDGSLTRVFLTPTSNTTIIFGTQLFYLIFETIRSSLVIFIAIALFGVTISGGIPEIVFVIALFALGATGLGMILSVLAKSQEQYMALSMLISFPVLFLSGVFIPVQTMPAFFQGIANVLPITYAADALRGIMIKGFGLAQLVPDLLYLAFFGLLTLTLTILLFKRELG